MTRMLLTLAMVTSLCGCSLRNWLMPQPFSKHAPCSISANISKEHLVRHLNENIQGSATSSGVASWRSTNVKITATGMPPGISVPASIAVEAPRNFRLRVSEPLTRVEALDMGSNPEEFWFWAKDAQPQQVVTVSHTNMPAAQRELRVPFDPDWLMEVLGVIPVDPAKYTLKRGRADAPTLELISESLSPAGVATKRVIRIDACHGIIREHALYDSRGILIARAALADHRIDQPTGLVIPHVVSFDWPAMQQSMKLVLGTVELNPRHMPSSVWNVPEKPGVPRFDLSQMLGRQGQHQPSLYGVGSPFGIVPPPPQQAQTFHVEQTRHTEPGEPAPGVTTFEPGVWWEESAAEEVPAAEPRLSRDHLTRRPVNPFAPSPP